MLLDQTSLLLALGFAGAAISVTLLMAWFSARAEHFLFYMAMGVALLVAGVAVFSVYGTYYSAGLHWFAFSLLIASFCFVWCSAHTFRTGTALLARSALAAFVCVGGIAIPFWLGFDGVGAIVANIVCAGLHVATAAEFWRARRQAPAQILIIVALYAVTTTSFLLCALALVLEGDMVLSGAPRNWAEEINAVAGIFALTGIGALTLALNQARLATRHQSEAMTDPLTGMLNRRALFERFGSDALKPPAAVLLCDLDHFKDINDKHGHAAGDDVLRHFAAVLRKVLRQSDLAARLGGEEFAIVLVSASQTQASRVAERIRADFESARLETLAGPLTCTVSIGIAICPSHGEDFESLLGRADTALYAAKDGGRNRVAVQGLHLVA